MLVLFTIPAGIFARESKFTKRGSGPLFWNMYQYNFRYGTSMPEDVWKKNIDWLAEEFLPYVLKLNLAAVRLEKLRP